MSFKCRKCGNELPDGTCYCFSCGVTVVGTSAKNRTVVMSGAVASNPSTAPPAPPAPTPAPAPYRQSMASQPNQFVPSAPVPSMMFQLEQTVIVNDVSGSMGEEYEPGYTKLYAAIQATVTLILEKTRIDRNDEIGIVTFSDFAKVLAPILPLSTHKQQIISAAQSMQVDGGTDINEGLKATQGMFDWNRQGVVRRIVLLTDGHGGNPLKTAEDLKARGVIIDVVGVGPDPSSVDEALLKKVASTVDGQLRYRFIRDRKTLNNTYTQIAGKTRIHP